VRRQSGSTIRLDYTMVMLGKVHEQELERDIEQFHLAALARAGDTYQRSWVQALLAWVHAVLTAWSPGRRPGAPRIPRSELA
jgi:hypothetical protein